jgi:tripartite-type tricarboxylate transporter receptor subunit TctC
MIPQRLLALVALALGPFMTLCASALAQEKYPSRPVEVVVPWGPGGGSDQTARKVAKFLEGELKASFPVVNAPGASGVTGVTKLFANPADGYSMGVTGDIYALMGSPGAKWKLADFIPAGILITQPAALFVAENSRFKTWADVEKEARAKPNSIKIAFVGYGAIDEIHINYLGAKGVKLLAVPFAQPGERYTSVLGGHADLLYEQAGDIKQYLESKQIRPILSLTTERFPAYKDVPTAKELGYDISVPQFRWVYLKAGTDPQRVKVIADAITKMAATQDFKDYLKDQMAAPDSFVSAQAAPKYMQGVLEALRREAAAAGMKVAQ